MKRLKGKNVLVTGAASGIGQACAIRFAEDGANIAINYRGKPERDRATEERVKNFGVRALPVQADVSREKDIVGMVRTVIEEFGRVDVLVNNAGIQIEGAAHEIGIEDFDRVIAVNLRSAYICSREVIKHFLSRKAAGRIINISSVHEIITRPKYIGYSVSKGGMQSLL